MPIEQTARRETAAALSHVRDVWGELLLAIEKPPADEWPPRQLAHTLRAVDDEPLTTRAPLVLREHPAPANLTALDAAVFGERSLFDLADTLAAAVQRAGLYDPGRWNFRSPTGPGSRAYGLHWAAVWVEGRVLDEDSEPEQQLDGTLAAAPYAPLPEHLLHEAHRVALSVEGRVLRALGRDRREMDLDTACPWCGGALHGHTRAGIKPAVTCATGEACGAPAPLDGRGRRVWQGRDLVGLWGALDAARSRVAA